MPLKKDQKIQVVEKTKEILNENSTVVFVNFHGLPVSAANEIREGLKQQGVGYFVAKKTLAKRAFSEVGIEGEMPNLEGELALAYGEDAVAPAREIKRLGQKYGDSLSIMGGIFNKEFVAKDRMEEIASIPSLQGLYGQLVGVLNAPIQSFVVSLNQIADNKES